MEKINLVTCCDLLQQLSRLESDHWKKSAYMRGSIMLKQLSEAEFMTRSDYTDIPGIGNAINKKVLEYKSTGQITKLEKYKSNVTEYC